ncbi:MAG: type IV secretory system conjugative DNA transfer family protein [Clostridiales Family XIII bacterium]|jgi:type IV secretory pathway TraG/TraD family ATPase VirD4|nr:type IV secretory system conjugative DNA transfer family protein [Clostridiales Family XIII bacterium]
MKNFWSSFMLYFLRAKTYALIISFASIFAASFGGLTFISSKIMDFLNAKITIIMYLMIGIFGIVIAFFIAKKVKDKIDTLPDEEEYEISLQNTQGGASQFSIEEIKKHYFVFKKYEDIPKSGGYYILGTLSKVNYTQKEINTIKKNDELKLQLELLKDDFISSKKELIKNNMEQYYPELINKYNEAKEKIESKMQYPVKTFEKDYKNFVCLRIKPEFSQGRYSKNQFVQVLGTSGSKKTRSYILPNIIQGIQSRQSLFITDPSHELYKYTAHIAKEEGYDINILNLVDFGRSDGFNLFGLISEAPEQDRTTTAEIIVKTIIDSTRDEAAKTNAFWDTANETLFLGLVLYVAISPHYDGERSFKEVVRINAQELMKVDHNLSIDPKNPEYEFDRKIKALPDTDPCKNAYLIALNSSKTREGVITGLGNILRLLENQEISDIMSTPDIDFNKTIKKPTITYIMPSDQFRVYDMVFSLYNTMMFSSLKRLSKQYDFNPPVQQSILLDEFTSIGIMKNPAEEIRTIRKYNIALSLVYQDIPGLKEKYPFSWESLKANIDTTLVYSVGVTDNLTAKYVSEWGGEATILENRENKPKKMPIENVNKTIRKRPLYTRDKLVSLDKIKGESLLFTNNGSKTKNGNSNSKLIYQVDISGSPFYQKMFDKNLQLNPDDYVPKRKKNKPKTAKTSPKTAHKEKKIIPESSPTSLFSRLQK